jgi:YD repeat-containing protein
VIKRVLLVAFVLGILQWASSIPIWAQAGTTCIGFVSCGAYSLTNPTCEPPLPTGATNCQASGPWSLVCEAPTGNCPAPPPYWCPTCGKGGVAGGQPINFTNGNTYIQQSDVRVPGLGGLALTRTWNSMWPSDESALQIGMFGPNWRANYEERVFPGSGDSVNYMVYGRGDGSFWLFGSNSGSTWTLLAPASIPATLTQNGTQSWTIAFQNGEQRVFSYASGSLTAITDRNGNTTQISYDGSSRLVTITDPASRHLYFTYASDSSQLVTGVSSDLGLSLSYSYDNQNRLIRVTKPDQTTVSFTYNSQSLITVVTDSDGRTLESHTYDSHGRGLTSARAGGVEAVTVAYPNP